MEKYDLIVIGSGPAGEKGAEQAAEIGKRVALIERNEYLGGAGINTGTVPSKTLRETALYFLGLQQRSLYGIDYSLKGGMSVREFMHRERIVVGNERRIVSRKIDQHGITRIRGDAAFRDAQTLRITGSNGKQEVQGEVILIATGSSPFHPPDIPFDDTLICDSDTILGIKRMPKAMGVLGGGVIGVEYASIFAALGVHVTLIESRDRILPFVDTEIMERLVRQLGEIGVTFVLNDSMSSIRSSDHEVTMTLDKGGVVVEVSSSQRSGCRNAST